MPNNKEKTECCEKCLDGKHNFCFQGNLVAHCGCSCRKPQPPKEEVTETWVRSDKVSPTQEPEEEWEIKLAAQFRLCFDSQEIYDKLKSFISLEKKKSYEEGEKMEIKMRGEVWEQSRKKTREEIKKRFIDFIDAHYLEYCRTQNGRFDCKNCGLNKNDLIDLL